MANSPQAWRMIEKFGARLAAARKLAGYEDASEFARVNGLEPHTYRKYEAGGALPPIDILERLCKALEQPADFLLFGGKPKPPPT
jgi:transcriptional regulator with XRE-family HTH domain